MQIYFFLFEQWDCTETQQCEIKKAGKNATMAEFRDTRIKKQCIFERVNLAKGKCFKKFKVYSRKQEWNNIKEYICVTITISYEFFVESILPLTFKRLKDSFCIENKIR